MKDALVALGPVPEPVIMAAMPIAVENGMMSDDRHDLATSTRCKFFPWTVSWFPPDRAAPRRPGGRLGQAVPGHEEGRAVRRDPTAPGPAWPTRT
ncbi:MAG: hypothetical protein MZU95_04580 [Desulfomicrobium escambiense]|nr:hypothetical protein [Desulfomicrobium escambiense]